MELPGREEWGWKSVRIRMWKATECVQRPAMVFPFIGTYVGIRWEGEQRLKKKKERKKDLSLILGLVSVNFITILINLMTF